MRERSSFFIAEMLYGANLSWKQFVFWFLTSYGQIGDELFCGVSFSILFVWRPCLIQSTCGTRYQTKEKTKELRLDGSQAQTFSLSWEAVLGFRLNCSTIVLLIVLRPISWNLLVGTEAGFSAWCWRTVQTTCNQAWLCFTWWCGLPSLLVVWWNTQNTAILLPEKMCVSNFAQIKNIVLHVPAKVPARKVSFDLPS